MVTGPRVSRTRVSYSPAKVSFPLSRCERGNVCFFCITKSPFQHRRAWFYHRKQIIMPRAKGVQSDRPLPFLKMNARPPKPRTRGLTEIRGPYYTPMGTRYLTDVLETMSSYIDSLKF